MWQTPDGDRTLRGSEAQLVRRSIAMMIDDLASVYREWSYMPQDYGVAPFDELTLTQQVALLSDVARHLLTDTVDTLPLTAVTEATVAAVFENIRMQIEIEIDHSGEYERVADIGHPSWRELVLTTYQSGSFDYGNNEDNVEHLTADSCDELDWELMVECLADSILSCRDFEMADTLVDEDPTRAAAMKSVLGIHPDYFTSVAPDPPEVEIERVFDTVREITHAKPR